LLDAVSTIDANVRHTKSKQQAGTMDIVSKMLSNAEFIQNVITVLITVALTGILVPFIKARMDDRNFRERKKFEEELARQAKLIEYQSKLLDEITELLWELQALLLEPTYYKIRDNDSGYKSAFQIMIGTHLFCTQRSELKLVKFAGLQLPRYMRSFRNYTMRI
jgi:large-conductance mechanosensitive channel